MNKREWNRQCLICNSSMKYFFSKEYTQEPYCTMMKDIGKVDYYKCNNCGFTLSATHYELSNERWEKLNHEFHHFVEANYLKDDSMNGQPPYLQQATMIAILAQNNLIDLSGRIVDYAGGYGTMSKILQKYFNTNLPVYDPYVKCKNDINYIELDESVNYSVVFNSAMFEHILNREHINKINNLVASDGCLILHTVICENVPKDPNWFYIDPPVHCAFHTNKSMNILMKQWGYESSLYCPISKCWVLFKKEPINIDNKVVRINQELQDTYIIYKKGFVDYWKGF